MTHPQPAPPPAAPGQTWTWGPSGQPVQGAPPPGQVQADAALPGVGVLLRRMLSSRHIAASVVYGVLVVGLLVGLLLLPFVYEDPALLRLVLPVYETIAGDGLWLLGIALSVSAARHIGSDPAQVLATLLMGRRGGAAAAGAWGAGAGGPWGAQTMPATLPGAGGWGWGSTPPGTASGAYPPQALAPAQGWSAYPTQAPTDGAP